MRTRFFCIVYYYSYSAYCHFVSGNYDAMLQYSEVLETWYELRENSPHSDTPIKAETFLQSTEKIIQDFFNQIE